LSAAEVEPNDIGSDRRSDLTICDHYTRIDARLGRKNKIDVPIVVVDGVSVSIYVAVGVVIVDDDLGRVSDLLNV